MADDKNDDAKAPAKVATPKAKKSATYVVASGRSISLNVGGLGVIRVEGEEVKPEEAGSFEDLVKGGFLVEATKE